ncbi:hypothetical protein BDR26DRAFT_867700 [Obelidium mucronatum]|nr:hypothetical protein BDR26DRAFT_867700 [Obelidium mucronatum]
MDASLTLTVEQDVLLSLGAIGLFLTLSITLYHIYYVLLIETWIPDGTLHLARMKQTFNINLVVIGSAIIGLYSAFIIQSIYQTRVGSAPWVLQAFNDFFTASFELAYVYYSSSRALRIITSVFPKLHNFLYYFLKAMPVIVFAQVIPASIDAYCATNPDLVYIIETVTFIEQGLSVLAAFAVLVFDIIFLTGFIKFVATIRLELRKDTDESFPIIAKHGLVSCVFAMLSFLCLVSTLAFESYSFGYNLMIFVAYVCLTGIHIALASMKIILHRVTRKADGDSTRKKMIETPVGSHSFPTSGSKVVKSSHA